jgi:hypothetical protein
MFLIGLIMLIGFVAVVIGFICMWIGRSVEGFFCSTSGAALIMFFAYAMRTA